MANTFHCTGRNLLPSEECLVDNDQHFIDFHVNRDKISLQDLNIINILSSIISSSYHFTSNLHFSSYINNKYNNKQQLMEFYWCIDMIWPPSSSVQYPCHLSWIIGTGFRQRFVNCQPAGLYHSEMKIEFWGMKMLTQNKRWTENLAIDYILYLINQ